MASDTRVYEPVIRAWEAITAAAALRTMPNGRRISGSIIKNGLRSAIWSRAGSIPARSIQAP